MEEDTWRDGDEIDEWDISQSHCREERGTDKRWSGHTWRRMGWLARDNELSIARERRQSRKTEEGVEIAITAIDRYFDLGFIHPAARFFNRFAGDRLLNRPSQWENVEDELSQHAVRERHSFDRYSHSIKSEYFLPIIGYLSFRNRISSAADHDIDSHLQSCREMSKLGKSNNKSSTSSKSQWLQWNGKFLDPSFIYQFIASGNDTGGGSLKAICSIWNPIPSQYSQPAAASLSTVSLTNLASSNDHLRRYGSLLGTGILSQRTVSRVHTSVSQAAVSRSVSSRNSLVIDLKVARTISCLVLLGGYPRDIERFPSHVHSHQQRQSPRKRCTQSARARREQQKRMLRRRKAERRRRRKRRSPFVYIVRDNSSLSWVTSVSIDYRVAQRGRWTRYSSMTSANTDIGTEAVIPLREEIVARYLRITPLSYHHAREMRAAVFGYALASEVEQQEAANEESDIDERDRDWCAGAPAQRKDSSGAKEVPTLCYTIHRPSAQPFRLDGTQY